MIPQRRKPAEADVPRPFWREKQLGEMTAKEWESLCDGCGKCCLLKVEYEDTGEVVPTAVACKLLDGHSCRCTNYRARKNFVPDCVVLTPENVPQLGWLPNTCAYRLVAEGKDLPEWHPLVSGSRRTVHAAGVSVRHKTVSEAEVGDDPETLVRYIVDWVL
jgi:uncharacterized cysteine cluster protein YcgN (CxxCxxCC family)